jgi:hypothetical protein
MVKPVVVYGSETWALTKMGVKRLLARERKILRKIHGLVVQQGILRIRTDHTLKELYKYLDVVAGIKRKRFGWIGHVVGRDQRKTVNTWEGSGRIGSPRLRWLEDVEEDMSDEA